MANAEKVLRAVLSSAYQMKDGEIEAEIFSDEISDEDATQALIGRDKARVKKLTTPRDGQKPTDHYSRGKKETMEAFEGSLKETYGIESDATGLDLVKEIVAANPAQGAKITDEDVKKHPAYVQAQKEHKKALADLQKDWQTKYDGQAAEAKKATIMQTINKKALQVRDGLKAVISANANIAANVENSFLASVANGFDFDLDAAGNPILMRDGNPVTDDHGNSVPFDTHVKSVATGYYEFSANNGGTNAGNGKPGQTTTTTTTPGTYPASVATRPKTQQELTTVLQRADLSLADKRAVMDTFKTENPGV